MTAALSRRGLLAGLVGAPALSPAARADVERELVLRREMRRRQCRRELLAWCSEALHPVGQAPAAHHRLLIGLLEQVAAGSLRRLMVFMPPGSAKSTYASDLFPPWFLAQQPRLSVIGASHTAELADAFSRKVRTRVLENAALLGFGMANEGVHLWGTSTGGQYRAAGIGGALPGFRADLALIDDPVRSREDADSAPKRDTVWNWFQTDLEPRMKPGGRIVLVMTRWHEDDLAARLLERQPGIWRVVSLPAMAEAGDELGRAPGELLWSDDSYGYGGDLVEKKSRADARTWSALYQQRPVPDTGDYFRKEWLRPVPDMPPRSSLRIYGASDYAVTADDGDYTVHLVAGMDVDGRLWLLDVWRHQTASDRWVEAFCDLVLQWRPIGWAEESGQITSSMGPLIDRRSRERRAFVARDKFAARGDKAIRAQSVRGRMALDGLHIPATASWRADFEAELLSFPAGKHDDQIDALGLIGQLLDKMHGPSKPDKLAAPRDSWDRAFARAYGSEQGDGESWTTT